MEDPATAHKINIGKNATVLLDNISINHSGNLTKTTTELGAGLTCGANSTIIIKGNCYVTSCYIWCAGIYVSNGLTIKEHESGGRLEVSGVSYGSGIGTWGNTEWPDGSLTIESGTIIATGAGNSPGIGPCAGSGGKTSTFGNIYIKGGNITAVGGKAAAGIGAGWNSECGEIVITGGKITASSTEMTSNYAAAIGGAHNGNCGKITINAQVGVPIEVKVTKASNATYSIGAGSGTSTCGELWADEYYYGTVNTSPYTYNGIYSKNDGTFTWYTDLVTREASVGLNAGYTGTTIEVPASYTDDKSREFTTTGIDGYAFDGFTSLTKITLPASIKKMGRNVFSGNSGLIEVICNAVTPPTLDPDALYDLAITALIRVPNASIAAYKTAKYWEAKATQIGALEPEVTKVINGVRYDINLDAQTCTVVALPSPELYKDTVIIPEKVMCDGLECTVMAIDEKAFAGCSNLKRVEIQGNTDFVAIGSMAFSQCSGLEFLVCNAEIPPMLDGTAVFYHVPTTMVIYVPGKSVATYQGKLQWNDFIIRDIDYPAKKAELRALVQDMADLITYCDGGNFISSDNVALVALTNAWGDANTVYYDESPTITIADVNQAINKATDDLNTAHTDLLAAAKDRLTALVNDDFAPLKTAVQDVFQDNTLANQISDHATALATAIPTITSVLAGKNLFNDYQTTFNGDRDAAIAVAKTWGKSALDLLLEPGDSQACIDIVNNAKAEVDALAWVDTKTTAENLAALKAQAEKIAKDTDDALKAQRESEKPVAVAVCDFTTKANGWSDYNLTKEYDNAWIVRGGANAGATLAEMRMGGKKSRLLDPVYVANKDAFTKEVNAVKVYYNKDSFKETGMGITEWGVKVYNDAARTSLITTVKGNNSDIKKDEATEVKISALASMPWPLGAYFEVYWSLVNTNTDKNGIVRVAMIEFWYDKTATDIDQTTNDQRPMTDKVLRNGQVLIIRDGRTYNILGAEVE